MSKYTTELRFICEQLTGRTESSGFNSVDDIIMAAAPLIFSFDFPIFDSAYKQELTEKIIRHFCRKVMITDGLTFMKMKEKEAVHIPGEHMVHILMYC